MYLHFTYIGMNSGMHRSENMHETMKYAGNYEEWVMFNIREQRMKLINVLTNNMKSELSNQIIYVELELITI